MKIYFRFYLIVLLSLFHKINSEEISNITNSTSTKLKKSYNPLGPKVLCSFLPSEFIDCDPPVDLKGNESAKVELHGRGCVKFGGYLYDDVEKTSVKCEALPDIECEDPRIFYKHNVPCIRYTGHYFATILIYSLVLGLVGMDRFCLGHTGTAVGKLLTLGGLGVWWIVDLVMLVTHSLQPEDNSNWNPAV